MANLKAVLQRPKVSATYSRNAFDRSFSLNTSYQLGGLEPIMAQPMIAGSHIKLNRAIFQRTADVNTAAFPKVDTHVEFFAVPIRLLWMYWNNFKLNIQDFNSTMQGSVVSSPGVSTFTPNNPACPSFDVAAFHREINGILFNNVLSSNYYTNITPLKGAALGSYRLLGAFGYGQYPLSNVTSAESAASQAVSYLVNPFKALAYQKVYFDHFRNTAYESNDPLYYNVDDIFTNTPMVANRVGKIFQYRYVNYRKDYFQSVYPSLNYSVSQPNGLSWVVPDSVVGFSGNILSTTSNTSYPANVSSGSVASQSSLVYSNVVDIGTSIPRSAFSVQQIRAAFALDKLLRASAYAPKHVREQFEARYGVKGVESGNESVRIGAFMNDILIQEVTNTAANLGEIGGKGVGYDGFKKDIEFTFKEDSILLGVMYSLPRTSYDSTFIENWNSKLDREDFFIPEFMNLGLQPFMNSERSFIVNSVGVRVPVWDVVNNVIGYKERYSEYKVGIDRNLGNFNIDGALADFVVHSNSTQGAVVAGANYFKVKPTDMDSIFVQATDTGDITTDKFITHLDIKLICNQNMSVHGQPAMGM